MRALNAALAEQSFEREPQQWAKLKTNIGITLARLGTCERRVDVLQEALVSLRAAIAVFEGKSEPDAEIARGAISYVRWNIDAIANGGLIRLEGIPLF